MPAKAALERAKDLCMDDAPLEEADEWFAVATSWWRQFEGCNESDKAPSIRNYELIDNELSLKTRKLAVLKPKLKEGPDFVFVPAFSWDVFARYLDFDWEIRREVFYWSNEEEAQELVDSTGQPVIALVSRAHTLGQLLSEIWLAAPDDFRRKFPQFLRGIAATSPLGTPSASENGSVRACYHRSQGGGGKKVWVPIEKMLKRARTASLRLKPRVKKRLRDDDDESTNEQQSDGGDGEQSEAEFEEHADQLKGDRSGLSMLMNTKLGDLRLDNRSEIATGSARVHELLIEQKPEGAGEMEWPSLGLELQWRTSLSKGDMLDALDTSRTWFEARILAARRNKIYVHYRSWEPKWDEWLPRTSPRIAPLYSRVPKWRSKLRPHALVQVGIEVPNLRHPKWRNAKVIDVVPRTDGGIVQTKEDDDGSGLRVHVQVDQDDIWLPANDDLLCLPNTHIESKPLSEHERRILAHEDPSPSDASDAAEESTAETEENRDEEQSENEKQDVEALDGGDNDNDAEEVDLTGHDVSSPPPSKPRKKTRAMTPSRFQMNLRDRLGPARNLNASFSQAQNQGLSSAGRTPARGGSRHRVQVCSDDTSPEPISPAPQPCTGGIPDALCLQALWTQVGNDLQALQRSWGQLGEGLVTFMDSLANVQEHSED
ncbi:unnamed protein product [Phytophthora fragariaefolia]|uniref:Unnamed protein product n=1 Tax=Phytophthora fragariaefolia TaxID=1490495 RepID=A0A9W6XCZ5_9STRA|nr:unnamed protein product [Phytophthora fragariaefolia]